MLPTNPEFRPRTDAELVALTDTRYHGAVTISMALELIEARKRLAQTAALREELARSLEEV